jgi:hypothetical protein
MNHARKMMLVPFDSTEPSRISAHQEIPASHQEGGQQPLEIPPPAAPAGSLNALDNEMQQILNTKSINDFDKWTLYEQVLLKFLNKIKHVRKPTIADENETEKQEPVVNIEAAPIVAKSEQKLEYEEIISDLNIKRAKAAAYAKVILALLEKSSGIEWDSEGNVSIEGKQLNSKIQDLLKATVSSNLATLPKGWPVYVSFLKKVNLPKEYILNKESITPRTIVTRSKNGIKKEKKLKWAPYKK